MLKRFLTATALLCACFAGAQTVAPILQPHQTFLDASGAVCSGCKLYSYIAGTTTPKATYTDSTGIPVNTNPITLDVAGGANVWMGSGAYKFVLKTAALTTIWTVDNVPGMANPSGTFLALAGGTLTGALNGTSATFSGTGSFANIISPSASFSGLVHASDITNQASLSAFGDSFTAGYGLASPTTQNYAAQFAAAKGWAFTNYAISGSECLDQSQNVLAQNPTAGSNYSWMLGFNDARVMGSDQVQQAEYQACANGELSWLTIPDAWKVRGTAATKAGTWTTVSILGQTWAASNVLSSTAQFSTSSVGDVVEIWFFSQLTNATQFTVSIDGVTMPCNTQSNICADSTHFAAAVHGTALAGTYGMQGARFPGLSYAGHIVLLTLTQADATDYFVPFAVAAYDAGMGSKTGPQVYVSNLARMNATGYANNGCAITCNLSSDFVQFQFDNRIHQVVSELAGDGLQLTLVDVGSYNVYNPQNGAQVQGDNVHPSLAGATQIAAEFTSESTALLTPRDRGASQILQNVSPFNHSVYVGGVPSVNSAGELGTASSATSGAVRYGLDGCATFRSGTIWGLNCPVSLLQFGGSVATIPALKVTGGANPVIAARKADDSADATFDASGYQVNGTQIAAANLSNGTTGSGAVVLAASPTLTGVITNGTNTVPNVGAPTVGQAACIKAAGPPVVIGYCSTVVSAGGACTCN